jgi:hypothetical protein
MFTAVAIPDASTLSTTTIPFSPACKKKSAKWAKPYLTSLIFFVALSQLQYVHQHFM